MHYYSASGRGQQPPVVALHGFSASAMPYGRLLQALRRHHRIVMAPEAHGHGFSPVPERLPPPSARSDGPFARRGGGPRLQGALENVLQIRDIYKGLEDFLLTMSTEPIVLLGNSLGGAMALRFALDHPDRVHALVVTSPAGGRMNQHTHSELLRTFAVPTQRDATALVDRLYAQSPWYRRLIGIHVRRKLAKPHIQALIQNTSAEDYITPEELAVLRTPTLFIWGGAEKLLPEMARRYYTEHLPKFVEIAEPAEYGHLPHVEHPRDLARRISSFSAREAPSMLRSVAAV